MAKERLIITRRGFGIGLVGGAASLALPLCASALTVDQAKALVRKMIGDIDKTIHSAKSEIALQAGFEAIFTRYADAAQMGQTALGAAVRRASPMQLAAFTTAYLGYISRQYARRFSAFNGGKFTVTEARAVKDYAEVVSVVKLKGRPASEMRWHVADKSGTGMIFNIVNDGIEMMATERSKIAAMLSQHSGDIDAVIAELKTA